MQAGYAVAPPQYAGAAPVPAQPYGAVAPAGYGGSPPQYTGSPQPDYGAFHQPQQYGGAAQAAYGAPPQQPQQYGGALAPSPQAYAPQDSNPAYGASFSEPQGAFGTPTARRSGLIGNFTWMQKLKFAGTALVVLGLAGWS